MYAWGPHTLYIGDAFFMQSLQDKQEGCQDKPAVGAHGVRIAVFDGFPCQLHGHDVPPDDVFSAAAAAGRALVIFKTILWEEAPGNHLPAG